MDVAFLGLISRVIRRSHSHPALPAPRPLDTAFQQPGGGQRRMDPPMYMPGGDIQTPSDRLRLQGEDADSCHETPGVGHLRAHGSRRRPKASEAGPEEACRPTC